MSESASFFSLGLSRTFCYAPGCDINLHYFTLIDDVVEVFSPTGGAYYFDRVGAVPWWWLRVVCRSFDEKLLDLLMLFDGEFNLEAELQ